MAAAASELFLVLRTRACVLVCMRVCACVRIILYLRQSASERSSCRTPPRLCCRRRRGQRCLRRRRRRRRNERLLLGRGWQRLNRAAAAVARARRSGGRAGGAVICTRAHVPRRTLHTSRCRCCCGGRPNVISGGPTLKISIHCTPPPPPPLLKRAKKARCRR